MCVLNLNFLAFIVPQISTLMRTDGHGQITRQLILINNIYTLYGRKRLLHTFKRF